MAIYFGYYGTHERMKSFGAGELLAFSTAPNLAHRRGRYAYQCRFSCNKLLDITPDEWSESREPVVASARAMGYDGYRIVADLCDPQWRAEHIVPFDLAKVEILSVNGHSLREYFGDEPAREPTVQRLRMPETVPAPEYGQSYSFSF